MGNSAGTWAQNGFIAAMVAVVVGLAKAIEMLIERVAPRKQVLSDAEERQLDEIHQIATARDEDGVPLSWFPVYARRDAQQMIEILRNLERGQQELIEISRKNNEGIARLHDALTRYLGQH